jgi:hypothetical protein
MNSSVSPNSGGMLYTNRLASGGPESHGRVGKGCRRRTWSERDKKWLARQSAHPRPRQKRSVRKQSKDGPKHRRHRQPAQHDARAPNHRAGHRTTRTVSGGHCGDAVGGSTEPEGHATSGGSTSPTLHMHTPKTHAHAVNKQTPSTQAHVHAVSTQTP